MRSLPNSSEITRPLAPAAKKTQRQGLFCMEAAPLVFATVFSVALHAFSGLQRSLLAVVARFDGENAPDGSRVKSDQLGPVH